MLTVKFYKYGPEAPAKPSYTEAISVREAKAVHVTYKENLCAVIQCGDAPGETTEVTVGMDQSCSYNVAYIMNEDGKTIETIR